MSNINKCLNNILSARYGKDVRSSIYNAIKTIDNSATTAQNSAEKSALIAQEMANESQKYMESAKTSAEKAMSSTPTGYAELVENVSLLDIAKSVDYTLYKSFAGAYRLKGLKGNTVQYVDILKYSGGAVSLDSSNSSFTYTLPTPLTIDPTAKYKIALVDMNGGDYDIFNTYASIQITDGQLFVQETLVGNNVTELVIGLSTVTEITVVSKTKRLTFSSIMLIPPVSPAYPQPLNHYGDCVEMINGAYTFSTGIYTFAENYLCNKHFIPCKSGDIICIKTEDVTTQGGLVYYNNGTRVSHVIGFDNTAKKEAEYTVPSGITHFCFNLRFENAITPQTVGKIQLTVNGKYVNCLKTHGKNELDCRGLNSGTNYGVAITPIYDKYGGLEYVNLNGTATTTVLLSFPFFAKANVNYVLSGCPSGGSVSNSYRMDMNLSSFFDIGNGTTFYVTEDTLLTARIRINGGFTCNNLQFKPMIRKADALDDTYEPYRESVAWYYTNEPTRLGDVKFKDSDGLFKIQRNTTNIVFDGTQNLILDTTSISDYIALTYSVGTKQFKISEKSKCDSLPYKYDFYIREENFYFGETGVILKLKKERLSEVSASGVNAYLAEHPIEVQGFLATPTIEVLDTQSQINLNSIETFDGVTYLECDSRVKPLGIEGEYGTSQVGALALENANLRDKAKISAFRVKETTVTGTTTSAGTLETGVSKNAHIITATCAGKLCIPFVPVVSAGSRPSVAVFDYSLNPVADTNVTVTISYYEGEENNIF